MFKIKRILSLVLAILLVLSLASPVLAKSRSSSSGSKYYKSSGIKIQRSTSAKQQFLKQKGYSKVPRGYEVDHIRPLSAGGRDTPSNMQLLTKTQHRAKTTSDAKKYGWYK